MTDPLSYPGWTLRAEARTPELSDALAALARAGTLPPESWGAALAHVPSHALAGALAASVYCAPGQTGALVRVLYDEAAYVGGAAVPLVHTLALKQMACALLLRPLALAVVHWTHQLPRVALFALGRESANQTWAQPMPVFCEGRAPLLPPTAYVALDALLARADGPRYFTTTELGSSSAASASATAQWPGANPAQLRMGTGEQTLQTPEMSAVIEAIVDRWAAFAALVRHSLGVGASSLYAQHTYAYAALVPTLAGLLAHVGLPEYVAEQLAVLHKRALDVAQAPEPAEFGARRAAFAEALAGMDAPDPMAPDASEPMRT